MGFLQGVICCCSTCPFCTLLTEKMKYDCVFCTFNFFPPEIRVSFCKILNIRLSVSVVGKEWFNRLSDFSTRNLGQQSINFFLSNNCFLSSSLISYVIEAARQRCIDFRHQWFGKGSKFKLTEIPRKI